MHRPILPLLGFLLSITLLIGSASLGAQVSLVRNTGGFIPVADLVAQPVYDLVTPALEEPQRTSLSRYCARYLPAYTPANPTRGGLRLVVVSTIDSVRSPHTYGSPKMSSFKTVLILMGPKADRLPVPAAWPVVLTIPDASATNLSLAVQLIFGGSRPEPAVTAPEQALPAPGRLGYALPDETGTPPGFNYALLADSVSEIMAAAIDTGAFPGAQVLVAYRGQVVYHQAFGKHTYEGDRLVQTDDIYDLASVTKTTGGLPALMRAYSQGKFDPDQPLSTYFDGFGRSSNKDTITYRAMLAHQARLRPWVPYWQSSLRGQARYPWETKWDGKMTADGQWRGRSLRDRPGKRFPIQVTDRLWLHRRYRERVIYRAIRESPLEEKAEYKYSGLLFYLLPEITENITGVPYEVYLQDTFYRPLGASTLGFNPMGKFPPDRIVPTERDTFFRNQLLYGTVHDEGAALMGGVSANAGLFSTANDLAKFYQMLLQDGSYGGQEYISSAAVREFTRYQYPKTGSRRGMGFDKPLLEYDATASSVAEAASANSFGHSGYTGTFVWADPDSELLYIFLSNRVYPTRDNPLIYRLNVRPRIHAAIYEAIEK